MSNYYIHQSCIKWEFQVSNSKQRPFERPFESCKISWRVRAAIGEKLMMALSVLQKNCIHRRINFPRMYTCAYEDDTYVGWTKFWFEIFKTVYVSSHMKPVNNIWTLRTCINYNESWGRKTDFIWVEILDFSANPLENQVDDHIGKSLAGHLCWFFNVIYVWYLSGPTKYYIQKTLTNYRIDCF